MNEAGLTPPLGGSGQQTQRTLELNFFISADQAGQYLTLPFEMPASVERLDLSYDYPTHRFAPETLAGGSFTSRTRQNIIDLGLIAPDGQQVGVSGSDKKEIQLSAVEATPGYQPTPLAAGTWQILAGAYMVAPEGVSVHYQLHFTFKQPRWLLGDPHVHTIGSDGCLSLGELAAHARAHGLDWLAVTDHNQFVDEAALPRLPGLTVIPGVEWTHYRGHANFLGLPHPYDGVFFSNDADGVQQRFASAAKRGALVVINHPFDESCPFTFDLERLPWHLVEVWNGPMRPSNLKAIAWWNQLLLSGRKVAMIGGSDYHRDRFGQILAAPAVYAYAQSASPQDILSALAQGRSYLVAQPGGARLEMHSGATLPGGSTPWAPGSSLEVHLDGLLAGDVLKLITPDGVQELFSAARAGSFSGSFAIPRPGFARLELWQSYAGLLPSLPVLLSNPIWFDPPV